MIEQNADLKSSTDRGGRDYKLEIHNHMELSSSIDKQQKCQQNNHSSHTQKIDNISEYDNDNDEKRHKNLNMSRSAKTPTKLQKTNKVQQNKRQKIDTTNSIEYHTVKPIANLDLNNYIHAESIDQPIKPHPKLTECMAIMQRVDERWEKKFALPQTASTPWQSQEYPSDESTNKE